MKLLFSNILQNCSISATNEDENYPLSNLYHSFLRRKFQSTATSDTIVVTPGSDTTITGIYWGYSNDSDVTIRLYLDTVLLATLTGSTAYHGSWTIDQMQVDIASGTTAKAYLGGLALGTDYSFDPPSSYWTEGYDDKSLVSRSDAGQILQEYVEPIKYYDWKFDAMLRTEARAFLAQYFAVGKGKPMWVDPETDDLDPMYCVIDDALKVKKSIQRYETEIRFLEAR